MFVKSWFFTFSQNAFILQNNVIAFNKPVHHFKIRANL